MKTKEQVRAYNKEYFSRPHVIARAKVRNAERRDVRKAYKKTEKGMISEKRYMSKPETRTMLEWGRIRNRYGISRDDYMAMFDKQNGCCAICSLTQEKKLHVDHCHRTNIVRGLLCGCCNRALGLLKDNTDFLRNAIDYLNSNHVPDDHINNENSSDGEENKDNPRGNVCFKDSICTITPDKQGSDQEKGQ